MKRISITGMVFIVLFANILFSQTETSWPLKVTRLSERAIVISGQSGFATQLVLSSKAGLVAFGTHWSPSIAEEYRKVAEKEFPQKEFAYVILHRNSSLFTAGASAFDDALIVTQERNKQRMINESSNLQEFIDGRIEFWVSRVKMHTDETIKPENSDSKKEIHKNWLEFSKSIVKELSKGYQSVIPDMTFTDRMTIDLGDLTLNLIHFGRGDMVVQIPEEGILLMTPFDPVHASVSPFHLSGNLNVPEWLSILDELLDEKKEIKHVFPVLKVFWKRKDIEQRRDYIRKLWLDCERAIEAGVDFQQAREQFSIDGDYAFLRQWDHYTEGGEEEDHNRYLKAFWSQLHESATELIEKLIAEHGPEKAPSMFKSLKIADDSRYYVYEGQINALGYRLLRAGTSQAAIAAFTINTQLYPQSANAFDSLGEAYMNNGDKEQAIKNYQRSLELNPDNQNAQEMLKKLKEQ